MELLYVWILGYEDIIVNQELNFSGGKYEINFLMNSKKVIDFSKREIIEHMKLEKEFTLSVEASENYIKNQSFYDDFWSKKISNISVIVGKNGSGKSTILKKLLDIDYLGFDGIYIIKSGESITLYYNKRTPAFREPNINIKHDNTIDFIYIDKYKKEGEEDAKLKLQKLFLFVKIPIIESYETFLELPNSLVGNRLFEKEEIEKILRKNDFMVLKGIENLKKMGVFTKDFYIYKNLTLKNLYFRYESMDEETNENLLTLDILKKGWELEYKKYKNNEINREELNVIFSIYIEFQYHIEKLIKIFNQERDFLNKDNIKKFELKNIDNLIDLLEEDEKNKIKSLKDGFELSIKKVDEYIRIKNGGYDVEELIKEFYQSNLTIITGLPFVFFNVEVGLSSGEKLLSYLFQYIKEEIGKWTDEFESLGEFIILLDEPDLVLHPEWQRKFIFYLIEFFDKCMDAGFKHHIIITTHSPLVLSDIPKKNTIFLERVEVNKIDEREEKGITKVLNHDNIKTETYASNIYSLYKNSFFLEKTIGETSYNRLTDIKENLERVIKGDTNIKYTKEETALVISLVGEAIIKGKFEALYKEAYMKNDTNAEIEYYEKKIQELKEIGDHHDKN